MNSTEYKEPFIAFMSGFAMSVPLVAFLAMIVFFAWFFNN